MRNSRVGLANIALPSFGRAAEYPELPVAVYQDRLSRVIARMHEDQLDALVIYADREHSANLAYLTGFDPRFEEAILLLTSGGARQLLVGNECMGYLPETESLGLKVSLFQELSLMGQTRRNSRPLQQLWRRIGIGAGHRVGCVGWKYFGSDLVTGGKEALEVPAFLVDGLRELTGQQGRVLNATRIFMDAEEGWRLFNEPAQIAQFEYAACVTSEGVLSFLRHLLPGAVERRLEKYLDSRGLPLSCHRMISFGDKAKRGLASPSDRRAHLGDAYTVGFGVQGALSSRAGLIARGPREAPAAVREFYSRFAANYFHAVATWYEHIGVGARCREVVRAVESARDKRLYRFAVNPGHYLHLDEWVHSPFTASSKVTLRSGMMLQMDIIPVSLGPFCYSNAEDGIVLADAALRDRLAGEFPGMWKRMQARRRFMIEQLGISLDESILPLGNTPGWLPPYVLDQGRVLCRG